MKKDDPFSGIKLSEQAGLDQRLFGQDMKASQGAKGGKEGNRERGNEASRERAKEAGRLRGRESSNPASSPGADELPIYKLSFLATESESNLFDELKLELRRHHGLRATKNSIARLAIRFLANDFQDNREASFLVRKLSEK